MTTIAFDFYLFLSCLPGSEGTARNEFAEFEFLSCLPGSEVTIYGVV